MEQRFERADMGYANWRCTILDDDDEDDDEDEDTLRLLLRAHVCDHWFGIFEWVNVIRMRLVVFTLLLLSPNQSV